MKRKIFFPSSEGHRLCGILSVPSEDKGLPLIVMCHGFTTSKDGRTYVRLEELLSRKSFSTFRFDFFGHGESEGEFADITISEAVDDVQSAIRFVKDSGYKRVGLLGSSFGGFACILTASHTDDLFVLALKSPVSDYLGLLIARDNEIDIAAWRKEGFVTVEGSDGENLRLNYSFFADAEKTQSYSFSKSIKTPTLIVHGDRDETVPIAQSKRLASILPHYRLEIIEGADHVYSRPEHFDRMLRLISDFIFSLSDSPTSVA